MDAVALTHRMMTSTSRPAIIEVAPAAQV